MLENYTPRIIDVGIDWLPKSKPLKPKGIVIHAMLEDFGSLKAWEFLESMGLSAHAFINSQGDIIKGQDDDKVAYHAGKSKHNDLEGLNNHYLGVELLLDIQPHKKMLAKYGITDRYKQFSYTLQTTDWVMAWQLDSLVWWCADKIKKYDIPIENIVGHDQVSGDDVRGEGRGKIDPNKHFPYYEFYKHLNKLL